MLETLICDMIYGMISRRLMNRMLTLVEELCMNTVSEPGLMWKGRKH